MKPEHLIHLEELAYGGLMRSRTPDEVAEHFIGSGYAEHRVGGLVATDKAHRLLAELGKKPKAWQ